jgi:hypothetical protein
MPKTIPSKRALKGVAKDSLESKRSSKSVSLGLSSSRKRRASSSTVSSLSSVTSMEALSSDDEANDSEDADDEDDQPILLTPPYGSRSHKAGMKSTKRVKTTRAASDDESDQDISDGPDLDDSSDDVYAAVDYISDGDDEEQDVEILEELLIVESEDEHDFGSALNSGVSDTHDWAGPTVFNDDMLLSAAPFFDEHQLYSAMEAFGETDVASETAVETPVARRVHFEEDSDSSSDSDSYTEDEIPSDFLHQDSLDPQLRRMIESDNEAVRRSSRRQSDEIYGDSDYGHSNIYHVESDAEASEGSSSGYESMHITIPPHHTLSVLTLLTNHKPMMARPQMKTFHLPQRSLTHDLSSVATLLPRWSPALKKKSSLHPAAEEALLWEHSLRTLTSQLPWLTALANILSSFPPTLHPAMTG